MLKQRINEDVKSALKNGDKQRRMVLGMIIAAAKNKEIEKHGELSDEEMIAVISSEVKKRKDSVEQFEKGGRPELAEGEKKEIEILMAYMPEQMSEEQIREEAKEVIAEMGAKDIKEMGKVLGALMPKVKGRADGSLVSQIVKEELSK